MNESLLRTVPLEALYKKELLKLSLLLKVLDKFELVSRIFLFYKDEELPPYFYIIGP